MNDTSAPSGVRHRVIGVCALMSVLLYLDRFCVSFAEIYIKQDLGLSDIAISMMISAFFLTYALGQSISGWMGDRYGGRSMLTIFILAWSLLTGLLGLANGLGMLVALRLGLGLAQAGAYPTAATLVAKWAPLTKRGLASGIVTLGGRIGGVIALFGTGYVILFFTPVDVDSALTPADILQPSRLCHELVSGERRSMRDEGASNPQGHVARRLMNEFPAELRGWMESESRRFESAEKDQGRSQAGRVPPTPQPTDADAGSISQLAAALNGPLRQPNFFSADELRDVKLEHEAVRLMKKNQDQLPRAELERLNRLVLEAVYPVSIKKVYCAGWRRMMFLYGAIGLPVALVFFLVCRDSPRKHPRCNDAERALIERGRSEQEAAAPVVGTIPVVELLASRSMWFNGAMQFFTNVGWVFLAVYAPRYYVEVHSAPVATRTWMSAIPAVAACAGLYLGGLLTDPAVRWWGQRWGRSLPIAVTRIAAGGTYLLCLLDPSPWAAVAMLALTAVMSDFGIPAIWALQQDVGGKYAGSVLGWGNMWGNFGAVLGPIMIAAAAGTTANWNLVFVLCSIAFFLAGLLALGIDATESIRPESGLSGKGIGGQRNRTG